MARKRSQKTRPRTRDEVAEELETKKVALIAAFVECGRVAMACNAVGIAWSTHWRWMRDDPEYKRQFDEADKWVGMIAEDEAFTRAVVGWEEPQFGRIAKDRDGEVGTVTKKSDRLLEIILKARLPEKYRERYEVSGANGGPVQVQALPPDFSRLSIEEKRAFRALLAKATPDAETESTSDALGVGQGLSGVKPS